MSRFAATDASTSASCAGPCCGLSRRGFLGGMAAASFAAPRFASAQTPAPRTLIDVHHHYYPPVFKEASARSGSKTPLVQDWTVARSIEEMDKNGVSRGILSMSSVPNEEFVRGEKQHVRGLTREINEFAAKMQQDYPKRYASFAFLPMVDVDGTLAEIAYALDTLKAVGVGIMTSWGNKWPGDPLFAPIFEELNRRKAIVYFHPLAPDCCGNLVPGIPDSVLEYPIDTSRAILNMLALGTFRKYPDIKFIFSHGGATIPVMADRAAGLMRAKEFMPDGIDAEMHKLYFETANASQAPMFSALTKYMPNSQLLFGTDFPYVTTAHNLEGLRGFGLKDAELRAIESGNALRLMPSLA